MTQGALILPVLPLRNSTLFPSLLMPLSVGRPASMAATEAALQTEEKEIFLVGQKNVAVEHPTLDDLYRVGTKAVIKKMSRGAQQSMELLVMGVERVHLEELVSDDPFLKARVSPYPLPTDEGAELEALKRSIMELASRAVELTQPQAPVDMEQLFTAETEPLRVAYVLASMLNLDQEKEQALLEAPSRVEALSLVLSYLRHEIQVLELRTKIADQARTEMSREQREYLLRQQLRAIQQELGESSPDQAEVQMLRDRLKEKQLPEEAQREADRELERLERLPLGAPDRHVIRTYLDFVLELPWGVRTEDRLEIANARRILDEDHYDLDDVKERILEHLGVLKLNPGAKAPILCLVGPPGVGKTSLGQSIARSMGRKFERMSLGGLHDEAELRGHRRTYVGAMPGRIMQAIRRAGASNPLLMLDEVDKLGRDFRGDPAAALLEILDPEQNRNFRDNYLDLAYDLSSVFFITTANTLATIPQPLLDRMEVLRLSGYTEEEKMEIARRYLIPRQIRETGLTPEKIEFPDETVRTVISNYTREAGLRALERTLARLARKVALRFAEGQTEKVVVRPEDLRAMLGPEPFMLEKMRRELPPGVATGLAWTETGGDVLYLEASLLPEGKGLLITGQLGDVMQESVKAAQSYIWAHADDLGIDHRQFSDAGVHLHVPAGAIPKDGPSAGLTAAVALASLYTKSPARGDTAMTGEITLSGLALPVGGIKEKILAARRAGIRRIILPKANEKDLDEIPENVRREMEFHFAEKIEDALTELIPALRERLLLTR
ncbi:MAG: endopeptidase La [Bryobacteraceae bacterium]